MNKRMPLILRVDSNAPDAAVIREAAQMIRDGLVVAYPTDTVYGLAVDPRNGGAVRRVFGLKGRSETSALAFISAEPPPGPAGGGGEPPPGTPSADPLARPPALLCPSQSPPS